MGSRDEFVPWKGLTLKWVPLDSQNLSQLPSNALHLFASACICIFYELWSEALLIPLLYFSLPSRQHCIMILKTFFGPILLLPSLIVTSSKPHRELINCFTPDSTSWAASQKTQWKNLVPCLTWLPARKVGGDIPILQIKRVRVKRSTWGSCHSNPALLD